jgi:hypothetical protein
MRTVTTTVFEMVTVTVYPSSGQNTPTSSVLPSSSSVSKSSRAPLVTQIPSAQLPMAGAECNDHGQMKCGDETSFAQCVFGRWLLRTCTSGTVCKETEDTNSPIVYCGFP